MCCLASKRDLYDLRGLAAHRLTADEDYDRACSRCELWVNLESEEDRSDIVSKLHYDRRQTGSHGRALTDPVEKFDLKAHDKLEPCDSLPDVSTLDTVSLPVRIVFWRSSYQSACTHRCPLFSSELGTSPTQTICLDLMHTLYLGPMLFWCKFVFWEILLAPIWGTTQPTEMEKIEVSLLIAKNSLRKFYESHDRANPNNKITRISNISTNMVGKKDHRQLKLKAMETHGFTKWLVHLLSIVHISSQIDGNVGAMVESGQILLSYVDTAKAAPEVLPEAITQVEHCFGFCQFQTKVTANFTQKLKPNLHNT